MSKLDDLVTMKTEYLERMRKNGRAALTEALGELFEKYPDLESVRWTQYAPYFNDGSPCVFSVHDPEAELRSRSTTLTAAQKVKIAVRALAGEGVAALSAETGADRDDLDMWHNWLRDRGASYLQDRLEEDSDDRYVDSYSMRKENAGLAADMNKLYQQLQAVEDFLQVAITPDGQVICDRGGEIRVEEYEHD